MHFVQPTRLDHVTSHMSTNLYQSLSILFTITTTGVPHLSLHNVSKYGYNSWNTPTTTPHHHNAPSTQTDHNGSKTHQMWLKTEQRTWRRIGEHAKDKEQGCTRYTFTNLCFFQQDHPPLNVKYTPVRACFGVQWPLPSFKHIADILIGACYMFFWPNIMDTLLSTCLLCVFVFFLTSPLSHLPL